MKKQLLSIAIALFFVLLTIAPCLADTIKNPQIHVNTLQPHLSKPIEQKSKITIYEYLKELQEDVEKTNDYQDIKEIHEHSNKRELPDSDSAANIINLRCRPFGGEGDLGGGCP